MIVGTFSTIVPLHVFPLNFAIEPVEPPVAWVHPCNCTLVAHESCLLSWIQSSQQDASRAPNALKCPQCGTIYELESYNPRTLRFLNKLNSVVSMAGKVVTVAGVSCVIASFGFGVYIILTSYGAYAVQEFLGKEFFDLVLTEDPSNWPWHAFINLPLVPVSLIISRTPLFEGFPLVPLFLAWTTSPPVQTTERLMTARWRRAMTSGADTPWGPLINWPPSPLMVTFLYPFVTKLYRRYFRRFQHWVMGTEPSTGTTVRRYVWALNDDRNLQVQVDVNALPAREEGQQQQGRPQGNEEQQEVDPNGEEQEAELPQDPAAVAERTIRVTSASLGRFVGGALLIPKISNWMGAILFRLSKYSPLLRRFLAIRPPRTGAPEVFGKWFDSQPWSQMSVARQLGVGVHMALSVVGGGTKTFAECDPVWWRNSVGLGIFVLAKDCVNLLHLYLTKREIETRRVKSRSFEGVDIKELDLLNPPQNPAALPLPTVA
ncbi:unnamed protein product [Somion occarium]|uniref:RING-CH-type domain-containing protein n=1 Tax=Somion occarium TaxID=3059160 RepID=A0ABP1CTW9_9APHY